MAQDSEKRFDSIMDKLFHAPKSLPNSSSSSGAQLSRGRKRPNTSSALALMEPKTKQHSSASAGTSETPVCRPWDRGDLMKRLATFKSMTWFAKPKVRIEAHLEAEWKLQCLYYHLHIIWEVEKYLLNAVVR